MKRRIIEINKDNATVAEHVPQPVMRERSPWWTEKRS